MAFQHRIRRGIGDRWAVEFNDIPGRAGVAPLAGVVLRAYEKLGARGTLHSTHAGRAVLGCRACLLRGVPFFAWRCRKGMKLRSKLERGLRGLRYTELPRAEFTGVPGL